MDWSTSDYTQTFADTFFLPDRDHDTGVYLLDEAGAGPKNSWLGPDAADAAADERVRVPIRPYGGGACGGPSQWGGPRGLPAPGRHGRAALDTHRATPFNVYRSRADPEGGQREGFRGNIISDRGNNRAVFDAAWDERPLHYNPNAGSDWAHLVPPRSRRPYGGGPAPSLAFPVITQSEAQVGPKDLFTGSPGGLAGPPGAWTAEVVTQVIKVILLVIIVVLLAMTLVAAARLERRLEKAMRGRSRSRGESADSP